VVYSSFACSNGYIELKSDAYFFILCHGTATICVVIYVDDIILTTYPSSFLANVTSTIGHELSMKDIGPIHHFLGISVTRTHTCLHLSQHQHTFHVLSHVGMRHCHLVTTPIDTKFKLSPGVRP
jgi:hypothetical protein